MSSKNASSARRPRAAAINPHVGAAGAALLLLAMLAALVAITGDPGAGAPSVRVALTRIGAVDNVPEGWREALARELPGEAPLTRETVALSEGPVISDPDGAAAAGQGQLAGGAEPTAQAVGVSLVQSPIAGLWAPGPGGAPLPIVGGDGRLPAQAYARPFVSNGAPKVALVVGGMGLNPQVTRHAIETLPPEVTLAFMPYAEGLQGWIDMARAAGHEVLIETPMEPGDYPTNDPGPFTLLVDNRPDETVSKLEWVLSRATGYFGISNYLGGRFVGSDAAMAAVTGSLARRGVAFIDDGSARRRPGPLRASADRVVDDQLTAEAIARQFASLEAAAFSRGQALGRGFAYPVTVNEAARWARSVSQRGLQLAPASALLTPPQAAAPRGVQNLAQNTPRTAH
jgi:polysaccharide deacetylase 2 family uncharacterized protein YibQ